MMLSERLLGKSMRVYVCAKQVTTNNEITRKKGKKIDVKIKRQLLFRRRTEKRERWRPSSKVAQLLLLSVSSWTIGNFLLLNSIVYMQ